MGFLHNWVTEVSSIKTIENINADVVMVTVEVTVVLTGVVVVDNIFN